MLNSNSLSTIVKAMGYENSNNFCYFVNISTFKNLSIHNRKVLQELKPYAFFVAEGMPLVVFFDDLQKRAKEKIQCKIWNAQIPIVISDEGNTIRIYCGKGMHLNDFRDIELNVLDEIETENCNENSVFSYWNVTNQSFLKDYLTGLSEKSLNEFLIENLQYITSILKNKYNIDFANKLILRILFIRYLIDRGIDIGYSGFSGNVQESQKRFLEIVQDKEELYKLFIYLKTRFNGNLFELDKEKEIVALNKDILELLHEFMAANEILKTKQMFLFSYYDFNIIPIELISNIYEILLGKEKQDKDKAFYTPEYLVDFVINKTVKKYLENHNECKVLDPSCGSGIFLVKSLKSILEKHADKNGFIKDSSKINSIVKENIFGVDYNDESVDVTIFSLYVTLFDFQDPKKLETFKLPLLKGENIFAYDFFDDDKLITLKKEKFVYILGNPPWGKVNQTLYLEYCSKENIIPQDKEISVAFILKVKDYASEDTQCSLIVPSRILYKGKQPSVSFRKRLLSTLRILQVFELSSVRKLIFKGATGPAIVLSFDFEFEDCLNNKIEYISLKPNMFFKVYHLIMIEPGDVKYVEQKTLLEYDWAWKTLVYGTSWDFKLVRNLKDKYKYSTLKDIEIEKGLIQGKGIQDLDGDEKDASHLVGRELLNSDDSIEHYKLDVSRLNKFQKQKIHRPRNKELFEPPYVFFKKGADCSNYTIKAVYSEQRLVYKETINCIKGAEKDKDVLKNITGLLNSSLFAYFNLMLGSYIGIEREQVFLKEIEQFPYVFSEELVEKVERLQEKITENMRFSVCLDTKEMMQDINHCIMKMYNLENNYFIDYALNVQIPLLCNSKYTYRSVNNIELITYADIFSESWSKMMRSNRLYVKISLYPNIKSKFTAFEMNIVEKEPERTIEVVDTDEGDKKLFTKFMVTKINDLFYQTKTVIKFEENSFFIVKTNEFKNWHPAVAVMDSADVLDIILLAKEDDK